MHCPIRTGEGMELILEYGSRTLTGEREAALELHLASCEDCLRIANAQRMLWNTLEAWEPPQVAQDFDRRLFARIAREEERPWYRRWFDVGALGMSWPVRPAMPVAAACATLLAAFLLRGPLPDSKPEFASQPKHLDMEQVERALDDIDMLNQLGVVPAVSRPVKHSESM